MTSPSIRETAYHTDRYTYGCILQAPLIHEWAMNILQMGFGRVALPDRLDVEIDHDIPFLRKIEDFSSRRFVRP